MARALEHTVRVAPQREDKDRPWPQSGVGPPAPLVDDARCPTYPVWVGSRGASRRVCAGAIGYLPRHTGLRFSRKARGPSCASSLR
ncbi:hypothetical protein GCM10022380_83780 [Amycolatopsis tucumanensis]|uniref:Uncharacterized protein n=1 Tax=Amycolatopsis tucumanensis TaxID=401106 RepID=A0ABP7JTR4_9PSEU